MGLAYFDEGAYLHGAGKAVGAEHSFLRLFPVGRLLSRAITILADAAKKLVAGRGLARPRGPLACIVAHQE